MANSIHKSKAIARLVRLVNLANRDFCPWANHYVYWLKEPVGWFVLATLASILVGCFLSPLGWSVAAGLCVIITLGLGFPWIAICTVRCNLHPLHRNLHERDQTFLELSIRNRLPLPIYGLMIEGILSEGFNAFNEDVSLSSSRFDTGLSKVPAFSEATYRLPFRPEYMGRYPKRVPKIACAFPFNIWTSRRKIESVATIVVRPLLIPIRGELEINGQRSAEIGVGQKASSSGDFLGVREFQRGDSLKNIHWAQSAKHDRLVVCERGGPQHQSLYIRLSKGVSTGTAFEARENLAWRIRITASLIDVLVSRKTPFKLLIDDQVQALPAGAEARVRGWDCLAEIPLCSPSLPNRSVANLPPASSSFEITSTEVDGSSLAPHLIRLAFHKTSDQTSGRHHTAKSLINLDDDITSQFDKFLSEVTKR